MADGMLTPEQIQQLTSLGALQPQTAQGLGQMSSPSPLAPAPVPAPPVNLGPAQQADIGYGIPQQALEQRDPGMMERAMQMAEVGGERMQPGAEPIAKLPPKRQKRKQKPQPQRQPIDVASSLVSKIQLGATGAALDPNLDPWNAMVQARYVPWSMLPKQVQQAFDAGLPPGQPRAGIAMDNLEDDQLRMLLQFAQIGVQEQEESRAQRMQQQGVTEQELYLRAQEEAARRSPVGGQ